MKSALMPATLVLAGALWVGACSLAEDVTPPPGIGALQPVIPSGPVAGATDTAPAVPSQPPDPAAGAAIYADKCEPCHGPTGMGDGSQASNLPNPPARLGDATLARAAVPSAWYEMVTTGNLDRFMPGFQSLTESERWDVVTYALTLSVDAPSQAAAAETYAGECADCHGENGAGGQAGLALNDPSGMAGRSLQSAYDAITLGAGEGMPAFEDRLSEDGRWALAAYVRGLAYAAAAGAPSVTPTTPVESPIAGPAGTAEATPQPTIEAAVPAATAGVVRGQVVQGTAGAALSAGFEVTLHAFDEQAEVLTETARVDAEGRFEFGGLDMVPGRLFVVTGDVDGVLYGTEAAHLSDSGAAGDLLLLVYETTEDTQALRVDRMHVLANFSTGGLVEMIQLWLVSNDGDRTIVAPASLGVLPVVLPDGALNLTFEEGTDAERFVVTENGFMDTLPVRPGSMSSQLVFSYVLPYDGGLDFSQPVSVPVEAGIVIVPEDGPRLSGEGLQDEGVREMSGTSVRTFSLGPIEAGGSLEFRLSGRVNAGDQGGNTLSGAAIGAGVLGVALIAAGLWWYRRPEPKRAQPLPEPVEGETRQELLRQLAELDEAHAAGQGDEPEYQARRAALKQRVLELMRGERD
ncbi:MAG: hypothetical protein A2Y93_02555 [Chloroflexi bacterium RBG_13_68_17]|nr:MAG: hypothetical protein A2Y93_02555 [Chloroflexi bacterium RBG_13_68_17]